jgi:hypothetical protein
MKRQPAVGLYFVLLDDDEAPAKLPRSAAVAPQAKAPHPDRKSPTPSVWILQPNFNLAMRENVSGYAHFNDHMVRFFHLRKR